VLKEVSVNNWKVILSHLAVGPKRGSFLRRELFKVRQPDVEFDPVLHRGQYIWYFNREGGLRYGYIRRLSLGVYEITDRGRQYLKNGRVPGFRTSDPNGRRQKWRRW